MLCFHLYLGYVLQIDVRWQKSTLSWNLLFPSLSLCKIILQCNKIMNAPTKSFTCAHTHNTLMESHKIKGKLILTEQQMWGLTEFSSNAADQKNFVPWRWLISAMAVSPQLGLIKETLMDIIRWGYETWHAWNKPLSWSVSLRNIAAFVFRSTGNDLLHCWWISILPYATCL